MKLLFSASVAVTAGFAVLTLGRVTPLITLLHIGTRCRSAYQTNHAIRVCITRHIAQTQLSSLLKFHHFGQVMWWRWWWW